MDYWFRICQGRPSTQAATWWWLSWQRHHETYFLPRGEEEEGIENGNQRTDNIQR